MVKEYGKFYYLIQNRYNEIKDKCTIAYKRYTGENLDDDIFHDTLLKCAETIKEEEMNEAQMINYVYIALRTNMLRNKLYKHNKSTTYFDDTIYCEYKDNREYWNLRCRMHDYIVDKYDEDTFEQCCEWIIDRCSVQEIEDRFKVKGLYYKFKKIKKEISDKFGGELFS